MVEYDNCIIHSPFSSTIKLISPKDRCFLKKLSASAKHVQFVWTVNDLEQLVIDDICVCIVKCICLLHKKMEFSNEVN